MRNWNNYMIILRSQLMPLLLIVGLAIVSCSASSELGESDIAQAASDAEQREPAPDFSLRDANNHEVKLSDFQGKVVLLNFWATWCGPCKIEMPWFVEFQRKYRDRGFSVIGVAMDEEGWNVVRPFADRLKLNFPIVIGNDEVADKYGGIAALPTTYIIDKQGKVALMHQGLTSKGDYEDEIEQLL